MSSYNINSGAGLTKSRIETLTDGVFTIAMTLLVLEITVPQLSHSEQVLVVVTIELETTNNVC
jgi:uncharacterized membrane protein